MLAPDERCVFTDVAAPPAGMVFLRGVVATYSLDMTTLLSLPLQLAMPADRSREKVFGDGVGLLDALRKTMSRLRVYGERGRILVPDRQHLLYGLLEKTVVEVDPPEGGSFHPKVWVLEFTDPSGARPDLFRLMVSTRNLTPVDSWDLALVLEGEAGVEDLEVNRPLAAFLSDLEGMVHDPGRGEGAPWMAEFVSVVHRVSWRLPDGCDDLRFHLLGRGRGWLPPGSSSLVVISPFLSDGALVALAGTTSEPLAVVSRSEAFREIGEAARKKYASLLVLHEAAETEEGEDLPEGREVGLHAKAYVFREWYRTHVVVGSANATARALLLGANVEFLAELVGRDRAVGKPESLLPGTGGLGDLLTPWTPGSEDPVAEEPEAEDRLEKLRTRILTVPLELRCTGSGENWTLRLEAAQAVEFPAEIRCCAWPVTLQAETGVVLEGMAPGRPVLFPGVSAASLTGFVAFELREGARLVRFVLNLPVEGLPQDRDAAILRAVIRSRAGFLRYLLMLLGDQGAMIPGLEAVGSGGFGTWMKHSADGDPMLLENLVTALARFPERLKDVDRLIRDLREGSGAGDLFPPGFLDLWELFLGALGSVDPEVC